MVDATRSSTSGALIVSLDIGSSSVRTLLFDDQARTIPDCGKQIAYDVETLGSGGVVMNPRELFDACVECLAEMQEEMEAAGLRPAAVAASGFWHSFLGVDDEGEAVTPFLHLLDTRSAPKADLLKQTLDQRETHSRVGCVFHPSYWPAKLLWLAEVYPEECKKVRRWVSFPAYLYYRLLGEWTESTSMMSGSGLWDQNRNDYDSDLLEALPVDRKQLADPEGMDRTVEPARESIGRKFPLFTGIPWFPAIGDGAANNIGSGCITQDRFALMVGTTGAMRAVIEAPSVGIPWGAWCYRIDRRRFVLGGALSDGGKVFEWMTERLQGLPEHDELERQLSAMEPGAHGLTMLPLFAGERSPNWNAEARAAITGLGLHTTTVEILHASLEAVALRFRSIYDILSRTLGTPQKVIASGGALLKSPSWTQMMAGALDRPLTSCLEAETSSRGAAMLALERLGVRKLNEFETSLGETSEPAAGQREAYTRLLEEQETLYDLLYPRNVTRKPADA